ncbi:hypothetical protein B488_12400 [Liberibacter crescens BT-1]|uniref:Purine nucleoside phosphorylase n=1 Tax=Liberibacter crescens (strain BT-1) TaxID=1215343 RepID=L0EW95_LIBCB|nr:peptidoglycan editing factor PgeF [Liberibacter crescens]AGA65232.1 hypothetical protein B488_12400 [Liberibacter crescens BT-1]AMC13176.1 polyphenol oxidase [Liberibacter crescens]
MKKVLFSAKPLLSPSISSIQGVIHGFFKRHSGVSEGVYSSLNVSFSAGDDDKKVIENRSYIASWFSLPVNKLITAQQVHSATVAILDADYDKKMPIEADGLVTDKMNVIIGVMTADCVPVLFVDPNKRIIGASHAGWRGVLSGILENTVEKIVSLGAIQEQIIACLGPSITSAYYEVGPEFVKQFLAYDISYQDFFCPSLKESYFMFDLPSLVLRKLSTLGVQATSLERCTYKEHSNFFSYRRSLHAGETDYGRQLSAILLT